MTSFVLNRRAVIQLGSAALASSVVPAHAAASATIGAAGLDVAHSIIYIGIKKGFFKANDLTIEHVNAQSGPRTKQMLAAGQLLAGTSGVSDSVALTLAGKPSVIVFSLERRAAAGNVLVGKDLYDQGIRSFRDLAGRKLGITQPQGWTWLLATYMADSFKIKEKVDLRPLGDFTTMLGAVKAKTVDACMATFTMVDRAKEEGWGVPIFEVQKDSDWQSTFSGDVPATGVYVLKDTIEREPAIVQGLVSALAKTSDFMRTADSNAIADLIHADFLSSTPRAALISAIDRFKAIWSNENLLPQDSYGRLVAMMGGGRMYPDADLAAKASYAQAVDMSFLQKARGRS